MPTRGKYIVIEGGDGTGKTTQVERLAEDLRAEGKNVRIVSEAADPIEANEPAAINTALRKLLVDKSIERSPETNVLLFTAARVEKWYCEIEPALKDGTWVIASRNYWSTLAYQSFGEGLPLQLIRQQTELYLGMTAYMRPDAAVILSLDAETKSKRIQHREGADNNDIFESRGESFADKVADGYLEIAQAYELPVIDAAGTVQEVGDRISHEIHRQLP